VPDPHLVKFPVLGGTSEYWVQVRQWSKFSLVIELEINSGSDAGNFCRYSVNDARQVVVFLCGLNSGPVEQRRTRLDNGLVCRLAAGGDSVFNDNVSLDTALRRARWVHRCNSGDWQVFGARRENVADNGFPV